MSSTGSSGEDKLARLGRRLERERRTREEAELISERATSQLYERQRELQLLEAVAKEWNVARTVEEAMQVAIDRICEHTEWPVGHAYIADESGVMRSAPTWHLASGGSFEEFRRVSDERTFVAGEGLPGRILASAEPVWIQDVLTDENFPRARAATDLGVRAAFGSPVPIGGEVGAVLEFFAAVPLEPNGSLLRAVGQISLQLGQFIERMRAEEEAERLKAEFFALVSHELRTPLTSIIGYLDLFEEEEAERMEESGRHFLDVIRRNTSRLENLVQDLLLVTQVEAGSFSVELDTVDLGALAREAVDAARPRAVEGGVVLALSDETVPECVGDAKRLGQVFDNLISNAVKFTPEGGRIDVRVARDDELVTIEVEDNGPGIPTDEIERLFDRFFRAAGARSGQVQGVGLGLAITEAIVEAHDGRIQVQSEEGTGTMFRVELPFIPTPAAKTAGQGSAG